MERRGRGEEDACEKCAEGWACFHPSSALVSGSSVLPRVVEGGRVFYCSLTLRKDPSVKS